MNSKARITYRFDKQNGARAVTDRKKTEEDRQAAESNVVPFFQEEMKFTSDIGTWNSPFQDDAFALEQLIRETDGRREDVGKQPHQPRQAKTFDDTDRRKTDAPKRQAAEVRMPEGADWSTDAILLGDESIAPHRAAGYEGDSHYPIIEIEEFDRDGRSFADREASAKTGSFFSAPAATYRSPRGPSWYKVFASVAGAVATGAIFGYLVLALFANGGGDGGHTPEQAAKETTTSANGAAADTGAGRSGQVPAASGSGDGSANAAAGAGQNAGGAAALKVALPSETYYMLQYGVFSSKDGLASAVTELDGKGLAAAPLTTADDFRVYVGVAGDRSGAEQLKNSLPDMEVYIKQIEVPAVKAIRFDGDAKNVESFFKLTDQLIRQMEGMTVGKLAKQADAGSEDWKALHQQWTSDAGKVNAGLTQEGDKTSLAKLVQAVNSAAVAAGEYAKKPSDVALWTVQASLMKAVFAQKDWFAAMDAL